MSALRIVPLLKKTSTFSVKDSAKTLLNMSRQTGFTADNTNVGKTFQTTKVMLNEVKHDRQCKQVYCYPFLCQRYNKRAP